MQMRTASIGAEEAANVVADMLANIERRSKKWTAADVDSLATHELAKAIRSVIFAHHESAAKRELAIVMETA